MRQCRPANPTDPGDAADLSIMGYARAGQRQCVSQRLPALPDVTLAQERWKINYFLTTGLIRVE